MWTNIRKIASTDKNVHKFVFEKDNAAVESVLYKYPTYEERTVICCSTQSGCPIGCRFCGTGEYFVRSLTADEIVSQPVHLLEDTGINPKDIKRLQIMFMSMGEPMMNLKNLIEAMRKLHELYPQAILLISTSGPKVDYSPLIEICKEIPTIGLQFSVHESTDENRNKLVPFKNKLTLAEMANHGCDWFEATGRTPFFNYCVHPNNNSDEDVERLLSLFHPNIWQATISVICERDETISVAHQRQKDMADEFENKLKAKNYRTRVFDPAGQDDISGGCGQLAFVQRWFKEHPELARPTVGYGLDIVHTPA